MEDKGSQTESKVKVSDVNFAWREEPSQLYLSESSFI